MRDKPKDDELKFGTPADEQPETKSEEKGTTDVDPEAKELQPSGESSPEGPVPPELPRIDGETPFRIKDQFSDLETISPTLTRDTTRPSKAAMPGTSLSDSVRPGRTIRKESSFQDFFRNLDIIKIVRGIYRRFWIVLLSAFGLFLLFIPIARSLQGGISWSATSTIIYTKPTQKQIDTQGSSFLLRPLSQDTLVDMFLSPAHIKALEDATGFKPLTKNVSFDSQSKSDIVTLKVSSMPSEKTAIEAVNKLADIIITDNAAYYHQLASAAYKQYKAQRETTEKTFNEAVKSVENFQLKNHLLELNTQYQNYFSSVNAATERLNVAQVAHEGLVVRIKNYVKMIADLPEEVLNEAQEDNPLKGRISNAEAALLQARIQYAPDNPKILRQERELDELRKLLQSGTFDETRERTYVKNPLKGQLEGELLKLRSEESVAATQVESLKNDLAALQEKFKALPGLEKEYAALLEKRSQADVALKSIKASEESARLTMDSNLSDFKLISLATAAEPTSESLIGRVIPIVGFILGFFGGLVLVIIIELLDAKIRTQQQLETAYDAPCLASIVEIPHLENYDIYQLLLPSLREISERLNIVLQGHRAKVLGFFSSLDGEGKSVLAFNLARYYNSLNIKVLFVGFDTLPNPCLPGTTESGWPQLGIEDYLLGQAELDDMLTSVDDVDVIRVQELHANLLDLAKGSAMPRLWDLLRQNYDLIITESPAVLDHPISGTIAGFLDEIIYVLASPVSDRRLVDAGLEFLEDRGLAPRALIFNRVDPYYIEDVRQQRIIRNLAEPRNPIETLFARLQSFTALLTRFKKPAAPNDKTDNEDLEDLSISEPQLGENDDWPEDEALPEFIGEDESSHAVFEEDADAEPLDENTEETAPEKETDEISFRDWLGEPDKGSEDDEK